MPLVRESTLIFGRQLRLSLRSPAWLLIGLTQPAIYLAFLGPMLTRLAGTGIAGLPAGDSWRFFVPGLLIQLGLFGSAFVGLTVIADIRSGVFERMRVTPVSRLALLGGRVMRDIVVLLSQTVVLLAVASAFGLRVPLVGVVIVSGFMILLAASLSSASYALGLLVVNEETFTPMLNAAAVPLMLLSGILLPMSLAPTWLNVVSRLTPFRYILDAMRSAFYGQYTNPAVLEGAGIALVAAAGCMLLSTRIFVRRQA